MRTWTSLLLALAMALSLAACGGDPTTQSISHVPESGQNTEEMTDAPLDAGPPAATQSPGGTGNGPIARGGDKYHGEHPKDSIFAG